MKRNLSQQLVASAAVIVITSGILFGSVGSAAQVPLKPVDVSPMLVGEIVN